jgi:farnesyl-diphosphate farnesyltransferase
MEQGRTWWPKDIWGQYGPTLESFAAAPHARSSLACLNHMVTDALVHVPDCLEYISQLRDPKVFQFCAIPQVMAISTLALVYNNPNVFKGNVKIRKGLSCKLMLESNDIKQVQGWFNLFARKIAERIPHEDPSAEKTAKLVSQTIELAPSSSPLPQHVLRQVNTAAWVICLFAMLYLIAGLRPRDDQGRPSLDYVAYGGLALALAYLFGFFGMTFVE